MAFMDFPTGRGELLWSPRRPPITETAQDDRAGPKCATPNPMGLRVKIRRDIGGTWSVLGASTRPASNFPSLLASLDYARRECAAVPATIELFIDGFYAVIHQERGWPRRIVAPESDASEPR